MTPTEFGKLLKKDTYGSFLFYGDEQYLKQYYLDLARKTVCADDIDLNSISVSGEGKDTADVCTEVFELASMPSMTGGRKFILLFNVDIKKANESEMQDLEELLASVSEFDDCMLVLNATEEYFDPGSEKRPSKALTRLSKVAKPVFFSKETPAKLAAWVQRHFASEKINAEPALCQFIVSFCGRDMTTLKNEISKLTAYLNSDSRNTLTKTDIRTVCSGNKEIDTFDFSNAVLDGNTEKAFYILNDMKLHKDAPELVLGAISRIFCDLYAVKTLADSGVLQKDISKKLKMHEYKTGLYMQKASYYGRNALEEAILLCHEADVKIKSTPLDSYAVLEVLLLSLMLKR